MKNTLTHQSSMIQSSTYDSSNSELIVTFNGGASYKFDQVTEQDYQLFTTSESIGRGFNEHIRKYNGVKLITEDVKSDESIQLNENEIN